MKVSVAVCASTLLVGCANLASSDPFSGTYHFADPAESGSYLIKQVGEGKWIATNGKTSGEPAKPWDGFQGPPMVQAPASEIARWFGIGSLTTQITCLADMKNDVQGRFFTPFLCHLPSETPYEIVEAMSPGRKLSSHTGYILIVGTPAGAITIDLVRTH